MGTDGPQESASHGGGAKQEHGKTRGIFQAVLEEGHAAAGITIVAALSCGLVLGFLLPKDPSIPDPYSRASNVIGFTYFGCWWIGWYPQLLQNFLSKAVVGLSFDQAVYNFLGFICYSTFNCALFFNRTVQHEEAHDGEGSDVRTNDLAFSLHCNLMTTLSIVQILMYKKGGQRVSRLCWGFCGAVSALAGAYLGALALSMQGFTALGFLYLLSYIKLATTLIKYWPQVVLNHQRRSTAGWNVSNALTDFCGGLFSVAQQCLDAFAVQDWSIFTGDVVKFGLGIVSMLYCVILAAQHYVFLGRQGAGGRGKQPAAGQTPGPAEHDPLLAECAGSTCSDQLSLSAVV